MFVPNLPDKELFLAYRVLWHVGCLELVESRLGWAARSGGSDRGIDHEGSDPCTMKPGRSFFSEAELSAATERFAKSTKRAMPLGKIVGCAWGRIFRSVRGNRCISAHCTDNRRGRCAPTILSVIGLDLVHRTAANR